MDLVEVGMQQMALPEPSTDWYKIVGLVLTAVGLGFGIFKWYVGRKNGRNDDVSEG